MPDKEEPKPGTLESWEKYIGKTDNSFVTSVIPYLNAFFTGPARYFHDKIVAPNQAPEYPYYHRRYRRVPTIDECHLSDYVCFEEANLQYKRDKMVEGEIVMILAGRLKDCVNYNKAGLDSHDAENACQEHKDTYFKAQRNYYIKYGDMPWWATARDVLMKQKHRMVWERRNGENTLEAKRERLAAKQESTSEVTTPRFGQRIPGTDELGSGGIGAMKGNEYKGWQ